MISNLAVQELFPTPLWIIDLEPEQAQRLNRQMLADIYRLTEPRAPMPVGGTWQTDPMLHALPEFAAFTELLTAAIKGALEFLAVDNLGFEITGCWANINPRGGLNSSHTHPNNYLSGVYYVSLPDGAGKIEFGDPRPQAMSIVPPVKAWNKFVGNRITLDVKEGRLVLFPAWLSHSVPVNRSAHERVSISFNAMFTSFTEELSPPLWTATAPLRFGDASADTPGEPA